VTHTITGDGFKAGAFEPRANQLSKDDRLPLVSMLGKRPQLLGDSRRDADRNDDIGGWHLPILGRGLNRKRALTGP
jgi:hypothetical protein